MTVVAMRHFGVDIDVIETLAEEMASEDGCLSVIDSLDELLGQRRSDFRQES